MIINSIDKGNAFYFHCDRDLLCMKFIFLKEKWLVSQFKNYVDILLAY